jgi:hypothetical protein
MIEPSHAPGWRGRPRRLGPIVGINEREPGERLARSLRIACYTLAVGTILIAAYAWAADALAGHING